jgi:hypothetical protein
MVWIILIAGVQVLGFAITLAHLAYDEWQQARSSRTKWAALEDRQHNLEFEPWKATSTM